MNLNKTILKYSCLIIVFLLLFTNFSITDFVLAQNSQVTNDQLDNKTNWNEIATKYDLDLDSGWNFISSVAEPKDTDIEEVFKTIINENDPGNSALSHAMYLDSTEDDPSDRWKFFKPDASASYNTLDSIDHRMGVFLEMNTGKTIILTGRINPSAEISLTHRSVHYKGTMVGYPSFDSKTVGEVKNNIGGGSVVYRIDGHAGGPEYEEMADSDYMSKNNGYVIYVNQDTTWNLDNDMPSGQVIPSGIQLSSTNPSEGDNINLTASIFNTGYETINNLTVRAYHESDHQNIGNITIDSIDSKSTINVTFNWNNITAGQHKLYVVIDKDNNASNGYMSASTRDIWVNHKPIAEMKVYQRLNVTLRVTGRKDNKVTCIIYENGLIVEQMNITRDAGKPDTITEQIKKYKGRNYSMDLIYNATHKGANPTWVIFDSANKESMKVTFKTKDGFDQKKSYSIDDILSEALEGETTYVFSSIGSYDQDGEIVSYIWDFGDGDTGTGQSVEHEFSSPGVYLVKLTVIDDDGAENTEEVLINIASRKKG